MNNGKELYKTKKEKIKSEVNDFKKDSFVRDYIGRVFPTAMQKTESVIFVGFVEECLLKNYETD
ncbi:MAG: hypothetical protein CVU80_00060 [Elusimicrobia bacterium HGW-Elusimicrobia-4]|nr:MAG: hypothetical protein CVU80_00060 [Elusimicrobia bacterium HGW-Elusimicrobia-4]